MCGIAGYIGVGEIAPMLESIKHRGPDQLGHWSEAGKAMGCRRLAVIDVEGGRQPIFNENGDKLIVFNGEIFNYIELRAELKKKHQFKTASDTEVILHAYEEWGAACLDKFIGMFAFAIWDGKKIFLARDRMGEKPLYYHLGPKGFFFASEIKAILTQVSGEVEFTPEFVAFEYPCGEDTYYKNIKSLKPGHYLEFDGKRAEKKCYWQIQIGEPDSHRNEADCVEEFRELLKDAVKIRLRSDVPVGIFLSGGIDSALIAAIAGPMEAFTCRFAEEKVFDEWNFAKLSAANIGLNPRIVSPTFEDFKREYPKILWHLDGPISTMSSIGEFSLAAEARGKVKVVLGGQGADELLGGYIRYALLLTELRISKSEIFADYLPLAKKLWSDDFGTEPADRYFKLMCRTANAPEQARDRIKNLFSGKGGLLDKMSYADIHIQLPALLTMNDRASAAYGLENRCPFLDHRIVEFAFRLPEHFKIRELRTKWLLREAARGLVPNEIVDRVDKKGLVTPVGKWLAHDSSGWTKNILGEKSDEYKAGALGVFDRSLYHAVSLKLWEKTRTNPLAPPTN